MRLKIISAAIIFLSCLFLTSCGRGDRYTGPVSEEAYEVYEDFQYLKEVELETGSAAVTLFVPKGRIILLKGDGFAALGEGIDMRINTARLPGRCGEYPGANRTSCTKSSDGAVLFLEIGVLEEDGTEHTEAAIRELERFYRLRIPYDKEALRQTIAKKRRQRLPESFLIFALEPGRDGVPGLSGCYFWQRDGLGEQQIPIYDTASMRGCRKYAGKFLALLLWKSAREKPTGRQAQRPGKPPLIVVQIGPGRLPPAFPAGKSGRAAPCPPAERPGLKLPIPAGSGRYTAYNICPSAPAAPHDRPAR